MRRLLRSRPLADTRGFSLVELLVSMLILSILAAIALPAWLDQRAKGQDLEAKLMLKTASTALVTFHTTEDTFVASLAQLRAIEPTLTEARNLRLDATDDSYELKEDSADGTEFTLTRHASGAIVRDCNNRGYGLCRSDPDADGNHW